MKKTIILIGLIALMFTACGSTDGDTAFSDTSPKSIQSTKVYSMVMYEDIDESYNKSYFKFTPTVTSYHTIHLSTQNNEDLDIKIYSDDDYTSLLTSSSDSSNKGEVFSFNAKASIDYYILIENYDNTVDVNYDLFISPSPSNSIYTKSIPMQLSLEKGTQTILSYIGYDSIFSIFDTNEDKLYMKVESNIDKNLYIKTQTIDNNQDLDIKIYSDSNYTNETYTSSSIDTTNESLQVNFDTNTTYYILIQNFTNTDDTKFNLIIGE